MGETKAEGYKAAVFFLLNPLTFGNTVLRRQDESVIVFFIALALMFLLQRRHVQTAVAIGLGLLVKLSAAVVLPVAFLHHRKWQYLVLPGLVFLVGLAPFLILAGRDAMFWDFGTGGAQHPFQYRGVSLVGLWNQFHGEGAQVSLLLMSVLLVIGTAVAALYIAWKQPGILQSVILMVSVVFLLSPKLHTGYFSALILAMAPLLKDWRTVVLYWLLGFVAIVADFYKWPIVNIEAAFGWMVVTLALMCLLTFQLCWPVRRLSPLPKTASTELS
jgi:Gpi18-like mannosyltransferase